MTDTAVTHSAPPAATAWDLFRQLLPPKLLNDLDPKAPQAAYTPWVVTWLLIYQRLHGNATLRQAVSEFLLRFPEQALPDCQRAQQHRLSANTGAYSAARSDIDARVLYWALDNVNDSLLDTYPCSWGDRRAYLLDGTTTQLASTVPLRVAFPPATNQHGSSHWPILHLVVAHELRSGLAIMPEYGPMYGEHARSELSLTQGLLPRLPHRSILLADRNFGVFAFAWAAVDAHHDVVVRLTQPRFKRLLKKAHRVADGKWEVTWRPSRHDRKAHPELAEGAVVSGWLHEVRVSKDLTLWLFTTLDATGEQLAALYHQRQNVESDIRDLKETLALGQMTCKSVAMVEKELVVAMLAYNLANQVRRLAAERVQLEPRQLSFRGVWNLLQTFAGGLLADKPEAEAAAEFERLLRAAAQCRLPRRRAGRSYPREVIPRRRKFPTRKRKQVQNSSP